MSSYALKDLWDLPSVQKHLDFEQDRIQSLSDFLKNLAALEEAYSQGLQKLVKINTKADGSAFYSSRSVFVQGVDSLMHGVEDVADMHGRLAETLQKVRKNLKSQTSSQGNNKQGWDLMTEAQQKVIKSIDTLKGAKDTWQKELENVQTLNNNYLKGGRKDRTELDKQVLVAKEANHALKKAVELTNAYKQKQIQNILPTILDGIQKDEKTRIGITKDALRQTCSYYTKTAPIISKVWGNVQATLDLLTNDIVNSNSADKLVKSASATSSPTFNREPSSEFSFSDSTAEIQRKQEVKGLTSSFPNIAPPGGKKKVVVEKTKAVEKEILEIQNHVDSVETLISVLREAASETEFFIELDEQRRTLLEKINSLLLVRHSYQVYLAEQERKPIPPPPKLNPVDAFQNDAFSPMSAFGAIELKASEFDDGGPSALTSAQPIPPSEPSEPKGAIRSSRFLHKKSDSSLGSPATSSSAPLKLESVQTSTPLRARRERSASTKNLFDTLGFNQKGNRHSKEISDSKGQQTPVPSTPNSTGIFSFVTFGKKNLSKTSSASNSSADIHAGVMNINSETSRASIALLADKLSSEKVSVDKASIDKVSMEDSKRTSEAALSNPSISNSTKSSEVAL